MEMEENVAEHKAEMIDHGEIAEAETQEHDTEQALEAAAETETTEIETSEANVDGGDNVEGEAEGEAEGDVEVAAEAGEETANGEAAEEGEGEEEGEKTMEDEVKAIFGDSDEEDNAEDQEKQDDEYAGEEEEEHIEESTRKLKRLVKQRSRKRAGSDDDEAPPANDDDEEQTPKKKKKRLSKKKRNAIENDEELGEEGEEGEKKKKKRKKKKKAEEGAEGEAEAPAEGGEGDDANDEDDAPRRKKQEEFEEFDAAMARLKHKRVRKDLTAEEEAKLTETVNNFIIKMEADAEMDEEANRNKQPATNKVANLKNVVTHLQKTRFADAFVNQGGFAAVKKWLQPLPDRSLPSLNVREDLLAILDTLPFNKELLQNSEVGKVVMFLWKSPLENPKNKRICAKIIEKWSRPIFGLNTAYRGDHARDEEDLDRPSRRVKADDDENEIDKRTREQMKDNRKFHARIPNRIFMDFKKMPAAEVKHVPAAKNPHIAAAEADKKIKQKRRAKPSNASGRVLRAEKISVEGRMAK